MKQVTKGFLIGTASTLAAIASGVFAFHKTVIKPVEEEEIKFDDGEEASIIIEPQNAGSLNMGKRNFKLASEMRNTKKSFGIKLRNDNIFKRDIGIRSHGFAQVAVLSMIVAVAGIVIAYLAFRY